MVDTCTPSKSPAKDIGEGWTTQSVERKEGKSAGHVDHYWYSPGGKKFRSRAEIGRFQAALEENGDDDEDRAWKEIKSGKAKGDGGGKGTPAKKKAASGGGNNNTPAKKANKRGAAAKAAAPADAATKKKKKKKATKNIDSDDDAEEKKMDDDDLVVAKKSNSRKKKAAKEKPASAIYGGNDDDVEMADTEKSNEQKKKKKKKKRSDKTTKKRKRADTSASSDEDEDDIIAAASSCKSSSSSSSKAGKAKRSTTGRKKAKKDATATAAAAASAAARVQSDDEDVAMADVANADAEQEKDLEEASQGSAAASCRPSRRSRTPKKSYSEDELGAWDSGASSSSEDDDDFVRRPKKKRAAAAASKKKKKKSEDEYVAEKDEEDGSSNEGMDIDEEADVDEEDLEYLIAKDNYSPTNYPQGFVEPFVEPVGIDPTDGIVENIVHAQVKKIGGLLRSSIREGDGMSPLKLQTACSGTDAPSIAISLMQEQLDRMYSGTGDDHGFEYEHVMSCEIEPFKQAYISRNFPGTPLFPDITKLTDGDLVTDVFGRQQKVPEGNLFVAGTSCKDFSMLRSNGRLDIEDKGTSGQTFLAAVEFLEMHQPNMAIFENVDKAPWSKMAEYIEGMIDLKNVYKKTTGISGTKKASHSKELMFSVNHEGRYRVEAVPMMVGARAGALVDGFIRGDDDEVIPLRSPSNGDDEGIELSLDTLAEKHKIDLNNDTLVFEKKVRYKTHLSKVTTKRFGLPQTRGRGYLFVWKTEDSNDDLGGYFGTSRHPSSIPSRHSSSHRLMIGSDLSGKRSDLVLV